MDALIPESRFACSLCGALLDVYERDRGVCDDCAENDPDNPEDEHEPEEEA